MADALLSANHFYMNCSYYNDTDEYKRATITVDDTDDILTRSENWLVHVTRFSCDSMKTVSFTEVDKSAIWQIAIEDDSGTTKAEFEFVLDQPYATPGALVNAMNLPGRFVRMTGTGVRQTDAKKEMYRFEVDNSGRIRLSAMPTPESRLPGWSVAYKATESMNKLLGFKQVTPFLNWDPSAAYNFSTCCDMLGRVAKHDALRTHDITRKGTYFTDMNECLIKLLNGLACGNVAADGTLIAADPQTWSHFPVVGNPLAYAIDYPNLLPFYKGASVTPAHHDGEALLPRNRAPMVMEWYDIESGTNDGIATGPKRKVIDMSWDVAYQATELAGVTHGMIGCKDITTQADVHGARFPHYVPGTLHEWTNVTYIYPFNSIPGYQIGGDTTFGDEPITSLAIETVTNLNTLLISRPVPAMVKAGHDLMIPQMELGDGLGICCTYAIEEISEDRRTIIIDYPIQARRLDSINAAQTDANTNPPILFTDRRVPFQSRSMCFEGLNQIIDGDVAETFVFSTDQICNIAVADFVSFEFGVGNARERTEQFVVTEVVYATDPAVNMTAYLVQGQRPIGITPDQTAATIVMVHKTIDLLRYTQDAHRMKMAVPTFCYEGRDLFTGRASRGTLVNGITNPGRMVQDYDRINLDLQVTRCREVFRFASLFDNLLTGTDNLVNEAISADEIKLIPFTSEVVHRDYIKSVQFGARHVKSTDGVNQSDVLWQYGNVYGTVPGVTTDRFPSPWYAIAGYEAGEDADDDDMDDDQEVLRFMQGNSFEPAILEMPPVAGGWEFEQRGAQGLTRVSPLCVGLRDNSHFPNRPLDFILYIPDNLIGETAVPTQPIDDVTFDALWDTTGDVPESMPNAYVGVAYDAETRAFAIASKGEWQDDVIQPDIPVKLVGFDGDYLASELASQVDLMFPFKQLLLTSTDLLQIPERSQANSRQPILSSYTLNCDVSQSSDSAGNPAGTTNNPFGNIHFSESGTRRFHHLIRVPGGLRSFQLNASVTYKDPTRQVKDVMLCPGGQFSAQLLFMKKDT